MSRANRSFGWKDLRVGFFILAAIGLLIFLILNASGDFNPFSKKLKLRAQFNSAAGLREGSEVRLAGVRVGKVESVNMLQPSGDQKANKVEAVLVIDAKIDGLEATQRIRSDSTAQLISPSFLSDEKVINITPGTSAGIPVKNGDLLDSSAANTFTDIASSGNDLVQRLNKVADRVNDITRKISEGEGTIGRAVNDEALYNNLNATIKDIQVISEKIKAGEGSAGKIVNDPALYDNLNDTVKQLQAIATDLRAGKGTAGKLFTDEQLYNEARATMTKVNNTIDEIRVVVADLKAGRGTAGKLFADDALYNDTRAAINRLNTTAERIDNVVAAAQRGEGTVGKLLTDEQLYNNINQLSGEGVKLIYDVRQNPKKFLTIKLELF
jgi:phospholipid/cholesterol/gamma-HCH transport system substrate-binding protein